MNITVISLRDLVKYFCIFCVILVVVIYGIVMLKGKEELKISSTSFSTTINSSSFLNCLKLEMPLFGIDDLQKEEKKRRNPYEILNLQLAMLFNMKDKGEIESAENSENVEIAENDKQDENQSKIIENYEKLETKVISENNITASFTDSDGDIQVKNQSKYSIQDLIVNSNYELKNKDKVVIYHTHTCESYTSSEKYPYQMTGVYRTTDLNFTVARVGDELEECLKQYGKTVVHDKTYHDYPSYNGSYDRSLKTMQNILKENPDSEIAIDLHRDAVRKLK